MASTDWEAWAHKLKNAVPWVGWNFFAFSGRKGIDRFPHGPLYYSHPIHMGESEQSNEAIERTRRKIVTLFDKWVKTSQEARACDALPVLHELAGEGPITIGPSLVNFESTR